MEGQFKCFTMRYYHFFKAIDQYDELFFKVFVLTRARNRIYFINS
jgi:hypothetical protein